MDIVAVVLVVLVVIFAAYKIRQTKKDKPNGIHAGEGGGTGIVGGGPKDTKLQ